MSYIGNPPAERFTSFDYQDLTGGTGTSFTLTHPVGNAQEILVMVNNVVQEPGVAYTVSGTALTMTGSIASTDDFYVVYRGKAIQTATHPSDRALTATDGTFTGDLTVDTDTLHVDAANNRVGIGLTAPSRSLHMKGSAPAVRFEDTDQSGVYHEIIENSGQLDIRADQGNTSTTGNMLFKTGGTERMRLLAGGGLTFNGDTATANALDDYEEGTWTPSFNLVTVTHTVQNGRYVKIGKMVHIKAHIEVSSIDNTDASGIQMTVPISANSALANGGRGCTFAYDSASSTLMDSSHADVHGAYVSGTTFAVTNDTGGNMQYSQLTQTSGVFVFAFSYEAA